MRLEQRDDGWWITKAPWEDCGPYETKEEAKRDMRGLKDFLKYEDDPEDTLGEDDARAWRKQVKERFTKLEQQTEITVRELLDIISKEKKTPEIIKELQLPVKLFQDCLRLLQEHVPVSAIRAAKLGCEKLADCIVAIQECNDKELANHLRKLLFDISSAVAVLIPFLPTEEETDVAA